MQNVTELLIDSEFEAGLKAGAGDKPDLVKARVNWLKLRLSQKSHGYPPFLTAPEGNLKLDKATAPSYGLTLQHYVQKMSNGLTINACPSAGDCTKVCVLDNGHGRFDTVQQARRLRTEFLVRSPFYAGVLIGHEIKLAVKKWGKILFRPNVNSDVEWHLVAPTLTEGTLFGHTVHSYGYSKLPSVLKGDVDTDHYTVAYSASEKSDWAEIDRFLEAGGNVAVVTSRKPKTPIHQWHPIGKVVDADKTDEWMLEGKGIIGDLSAKGKARHLIGVSKFVKEI